MNTKASEGAGGSWQDGGPVPTELRLTADWLAWQSPAPSPGIDQLAATVGLQRSDISAAGHPPPSSNSLVPTLPAPGPYCCHLHLDRG